MFLNVELRKLPAGALYGIIDILETNNDWKKVMSVIPKNPIYERFEAKYNNEHIRLIEEHSRTSGRRCSEIMFDEWSTSGRIRPTLNTLKELVIKAEIYRAADEIALMLQEEIPARPSNGPAAPIGYDLSQMLKDDSLLQNINAMESINKTKFGTNTYDLDKTIGNKTTRQMKSASDLIQFSTVQPPVIKVEEPSLESINIPNFSAIMTKSELSGTQENDTSTSATESDPESSALLAAPDQQVTPEAYSPDVYQMSLPNIEFEQSHSRSGIDTSILQDTNLIHFHYQELERITNEFSDNLVMTPYGLIGRIGSGGFGEVFTGYHPKLGLLAVKKALNISVGKKPDIIVQVFNTEIKYLSQFRHKNIVPIIGFSRDGPALCIVCEYVEGGSLEQKLAEKVLSEKQRIDIMTGTAEGLKYLHGSCEPIQNNSVVYKTIESDSQNSKKNNTVHGDVKSANILLTRDCVPKLCDFGLAKQLDTTFYTTSPMGTSAYMAPEGFSGTITQKIDIYSYGIVLLELLTGLRPIISSNSEKINIKDYVEENCPNDITNLLDPVVTKWSKANEIFDLSLKCLQRARKSRPTINEVCDILHNNIYF